MKIFRNKWFLIILLILAVIAFTIARLARGMRVSGHTYRTDSQHVSQSENSGMLACVCHSKKPSMVRMHNALAGESCGDCHKLAEGLMNLNRTSISPTDMDKRIKTEAVCKRCHLADGTILGQKHRVGK